VSADASRAFPLFPEKTLKRLLLTLALLLAAPLAAAQGATAFPSKPIRIIVPFNAVKGVLAAGHRILLVSVSSIGVNPTVLNDVIAGQLDSAAIDFAGVVPQIRVGRLHALAMKELDDLQMREYGRPKKAADAAGIRPE
jgi:tripartite-type tricarboxylate transporter receptor subunit TctC